MTRPGLVLAIAAAVSLPAPAYYHFIHYLNGVAAPEKFDLAALPDKTVTFFVSENGPTTYSPTDSFNSVVSQLRQAATAWNSVPTSDLRVVFGGVENTATLQNTPGGDIVFEDLPPGLLGYGGPTSVDVPNTTGAPFVPIRRSAVHLNRNLRVAPGPSYNETFFMTSVHEMGHALGLQHTFTSATMSTATTRATTLSHPIDSDDIAAISVLYPNAAFARLGSISGRITNGGAGVHLSSVVAIRAGGSAVSALTNPDGTYRIDGIPPGQYFVYAHPLPPDADIFGPWNQDGTVAARSGPTNALFYPGTTVLGEATPISVQSAKIVEGINIALASRPSVAIYDAGVYGYFNNYSIAVKPAYVNVLSADNTVVAAGIGLGANGQAPGLNVNFLGNSAFLLDGGVRPYQSSGYTYIALDLGYNLFGGPGPQHLVFSTPSFLHVLPSGVILTRKSPPTVDSLTGNGDGTITVKGTNWNDDSLIYFDGLPSTLVSLDAKAGAAVVVPPAGADRQTAVVTVYNTDGQNSQFVQSSAPLTWSYGASATPTIAALNPSSLPVGSESVVEITTTGFSFVPGQVVVGFGSSDIIVRKVFVAGPNRLLVNVSVATGAALSSPNVSVISGFQMSTAPAGFRITPAVPGVPVTIPVFANAASGLNGTYAGAQVVVRGRNLTTDATAPTVTVGNLSAVVSQASADQIVFVIPAGAPLGPTTVVVNNGVANALPVILNVDTQPARIAQISNGAGAVNAQNPARQAELVVISLDGFAPANGSIIPERVQVAFGGVLRQALAITSGPGETWQVTALVSATEKVGQTQQVIVYFDGRSSYPAAIPISRPDGSFAVQPDPTTPSESSN